MVRYFPVSLVGRPPIRPRSRAALIPALVLSRMRLRSYSERALKIWSVKTPLGVLVSIFSDSDTKPMPCFSRSETIRIRSARFRPSRSSLFTQRISPARSALRQLSSSGRSVFLPLACSWWIFSHPCAVRASICRSRFCSWDSQNSCYFDVIPSFQHCFCSPVLGDLRRPRVFVV